MPQGKSNRDVRKTLMNLVRDSKQVVLVGQDKTGETLLQWDASSPVVAGMMIEAANDYFRSTMAKAFRPKGIISNDDKPELMAASMRLSESIKVGDKGEIHDAVENLVSVWRKYDHNE